MARARNDAARRGAPPRGGAVTGRVVDDRGEPRAGVELVVPGGATAWQTLHGLEDEAPVVVATTDADGRFRVDHLRSLPRGVWIVDGAERPEALFAPTLFARDPRFADWGWWGAVRFEAETDEGTERALPDLVLPRSARVSGVVVDELGVPQEGVLVSAEPRRMFETEGALRAGGSAVLPGDPAFVLRMGEARTDARGAFELEQLSRDSGPWTGRLLLLSPDFLRVLEVSGAVAPGERQDDLRFVLRRSEFVALELALAGGAPLSIVGVRRAEDHVQLFGRQRVSSAFSQVELVFRFQDGAEKRIDAHPGVDGIVREELGRATRDVRALEVSVPGCVRAELELSEGLDAGRALRVELAPRPALRVRVDWEAGAWPEALESVSVHACRLAELPSDGVRNAWANRIDCCGLGSRGARTRESATAPLELPVASREPYYLHVTGRGPSGVLRVQRFGPFEPGPDVRAIVVRPEVLPEERDERPLRPPPEPGAAEARVELRARGVDARDGRELACSLSARRRGTEWNSIGSWSWSLRAEAPARIEAGTWELRVESAGHRATELGARTLAPGAVVDFGTVPLEPLPARRGRFLDAAGGPWGAGAYVRAEGASSAVDEMGRFVLRGDLDEEGLLRVSGPIQARELRAAERGLEPDRLPLGCAVLPVGAWKEDEERVIAAPRFRDVLVRVVGLPPEHEEATLAVLVRSTLEREGQGVFGAEPGRVSDGRFAFRLAPGTYVAELVCPLHPAAPIEFEVGPDGAEGACVAEFGLR
ncbi:MAG: carboxypeptidase regulatory-like domain-containing protein [Planctomycetes bacterium]|nr:carboxypeptidase regulatory-like domain-containing protein [Planctomycetota bacterium]